MRMIPPEPLVIPDFNFDDDYFITERIDWVFEDEDKYMAFF